MDTDTLILTNLFKDTMNVTVKPHHHMKKEELLEEIKGITEKKEEFEVYFFVFLTYLYNEDKTTDGVRIQCYDDPISLEEIFDLVKDKPPFIGKQKIFLVQANDQTILRGATKTVVYEGEETPLPIQIHKIPTDCDRLVMFSTLPQQLYQDLHTATTSQITSGVGNINITDAGKAVKSPSDNSQNPNAKASLLVAAFDEVIRAALADQALKTEDLLTQTTRINRIIDFKIKQLKTLKIFKDTKFQIPLVTSTLRNQVYMLDFDK